VEHSPNGHRNSWQTRRKSKGTATQIAAGILRFHGCEALGKRKEKEIAKGY
jgi:hypothetical protein